MLNGKLHFLCSVKSKIRKEKKREKQILMCILDKVHALVWCSSLMLLKIPFAIKIKRRLLESSLLN